MPFPKWGKKAAVQQPVTADNPFTTQAAEGYTGNTPAGALPPPPPQKMAPTSGRPAPVPVYNGK